ncbi:MAG: DnaJ domain-containing protein, partial [Halobacteria archaeon]|nr:DnaJ domain-containing protein [Halobacteria archaeon]
MDLLKCYQILGVPRDCTWEELRTAYRRQVQKHHPDRYQQQPGRQLIAKKRMLELNKAFDTLAEYYKKNGHLPADVL